MRSIKLVLQIMAEPLPFWAEEPERKAINARNSRVSAILNDIRFDK